MRYLIKRELSYGTTYMGVSAERIRKVTEERVRLYGFKTMDGAERAMERASKYMTTAKLTIVPFPID